MKKIYSILFFFHIVFSGFSQYESAFWGMTYDGGNGGGVVFKTNGYGDSLEVMQHFINLPGRNPLYSQLCEASNGKHYGMTFGGGPYDCGVLFEYDPALAVYTAKVIFTGSANGKNPYGALTAASNGKLYGMTQSGGANNLGVLFEYDPVSGVFTKKIDFVSATTGRNPYGSLLAASNGLMYGLMSGGGSNNMGVLFEFNTTTGVLTKKWDFDGTATGRSPYGTPMQASNGKLYGMTSIGGTSNMGVIFEYDISTGILLKKFDFTGVATGRGPYGNLTEYSNNKLYGLTPLGGTSGLGVLFEFDPSTATFTKKIDFDGPLYGRSPYGSLINACGVLYGMTSAGGSNNKGVIFQFDPGSGVVTRNQDFDGTAMGSTPFGSLFLASNGKLYGLTNAGGLNNYGVVFEYNCTTNTFLKKVDLAITIDGGYPYGSLTYASDKMLYGNTTYGGNSDFGVIFKINPPANIYTKVLDYDNVTNGSYPVGPLTEAANGKMYGMTYSGGVNDMGTLFEFDPSTGINTVKRNLDSSSTGSFPYGSLTETSSGNLYGMTSFGGSSNQGTIFHYNYLTDTYVSKMSFNGTATGASPYGEFTMAPNGKLYAMTNSGGTNNMGVLFEYDFSTDTYTKKIDFAGTTNGANPYGSLTLASNGKLYGLTSKGGSSNMGTLFEYDPATSVLTKKIDFTGTSNGNDPQGTMLESSGGKLYGMTRTGGSNNLGVLFEFDPATGILVKKFDFDAEHGKNPYYTKLVEICEAPEFTSPVSDASVCLYENTFFKCFTTGNWLTYQWQVNMGAGFVNVTDNAVYSGSLTDSLHLTGATAGMNNYTYRCVVTSTCPDSSIITNAAYLRVRPHYEISENREICDNESYFWRGNTYVSAGTYYDSLITQYGCDSVFVLNLIVHPTFEFDNYAEICDNESYLWHGHIYTLPGTYYDSLTTIYGCDSVYILHLITHPTFEIPFTAEICDNENYLWRGNTYAAAGPYYDSLSTQFGCDSVYILHLIVHPTYEDNFQTEICDNESYSWRGNTYNLPGVYYDSLTSQFGCDSVYVLNLIVHPTFETHQYAEICDNENYIWRGNSYTYAGIFYDSLTTMYGCDSVYILHLTVHPTYEFVQIAQICDNESFVWRGNTYSTAGIYHDNLTTQFGCDSIYTLHLIVHPTYLFSETGQVCDNDVYLWRGYTLQTAGIYYDSLTSQSGCDSVYMINLIVNPTFEIPQTAEICDNESYFWRGRTLVNPGLYYDSLFSQSGCDSVYILNLIVHPTYEFTFDADICQMETYSWRGNSYSVAGIYYDSLTTGHGCDSVFILNLRVHPNFEIPSIAYICNHESYIWRGRTLSQTGVYYDSLTTQYGCDSVFILALIVRPTYEFVQNKQICHGSVYQWHGHTYYNSGTYYDSLTTQYGCDSVYILNLIVNPVYEYVTDVAICNNQSYTWRGGTYYNPGTYYNHFVSINGCDSNFVLHLTVHPAFEYEETAEICADESYLWRGQTYTTAGTYYDSLSTMYGCDSVYILHLIVHPLFNEIENIDICDNGSYFWRGNTYTATGIYTENLVSAFGCDSVYTLNLTVHPTYEFAEASTICSNNPYMWHGNLYDLAGTYYDSLTTTNGCDSVYILTLDVNPAFDSTEIAEICDNGSYFWRGNDYYTAGIYYDSLQTSLGCDSVYILDLIVHPVYLITDTTEICYGNDYFWHGNTYSTTGIFYDSLITSSGCDSIHALDLTVNTLPVVTLLNLDNFYCVYNLSVTMNGLPAGGTFSGNGVSGNVFDPATAGLGTWPVVYSYTDGNGCSNSDTINVEVSTCDGIETIDLFEISIYPNPTSGKLVITLPDENGYSVSLTDALGKIILSELIDGQKSAYLDLGSFAPGVYVLKVENAEGFVLKRVVKE